MRYVASDGKVIQISDMQDNYLLNAFLARKKELAALNSISPDQRKYVKARMDELQVMLTELKEEIKKRGLMEI